MTRRPRPNPASALHQLRNRYGEGADAAKLALLQRLLARPPHTHSALVRLHDDLLFLRAFPDSPAIFAAARQGLDRAARMIRRMPTRSVLDDSGTAGTVSRHTFPLAITRWLVSSASAEVDIDWAAIDDTTNLDALLRTFLSRAEEDAFDGGDISTRAWMRTAVPHHARSDLTWLLENGLANGQRAARFAAVYDTAPLPVRWRLGRSAYSTTCNELSGCAPQARTSMRRTPPQPIRHIATPLASIELLPSRRAHEVIAVTRAALTARCREVFAISNPNPREVWLAALGEGVQLAVIGAEPSLRMSVESNYGYLLLSNGVPVGYGGVTPLWNQANTGINIFDPFRGSEAAFLWAQMLRAFHSLFGVRRFLINGYQFGEGNTEAITSGAFWFYYRLGFRPAGRAQRTLAADEAARVGNDRAYRSPPATLRALAHGDLHLTLPGYRASTFVDERLLQVASLAVTNRLASGVSRDDAHAQILDRVSRALGVRRRSWPVEEHAAFERLAPVLDLIPSIASWSGADKQGLVALARSKGGPQEREFVLQARHHRRFWPALKQQLLALERSQRR